MQRDRLPARFTRGARLKVAALGLSLAVGSGVLVAGPANAYTPHCSTVSQVWHIGEKPVPYTLANVAVTGRACVASDGYIDNANSYLHFSLYKVNVSSTRWATRGVVQIGNTRVQEIWRFYGSDQWCAYWICGPNELWFFQASLITLTRGSPPIVTRSLIVCQNTWCGGAGHTDVIQWR